MADILKKKIRSRNIHTNAIKKIISTNIEEVYKNYTQEKLTVQTIRNGWLSRQGGNVFCKVHGFYLHVYCHVLLCKYFS